MTDLHAVWELLSQGNTVSPEVIDALCTEVLSLRDVVNALPKCDKCSKHAHGVDINQNPKCTSCIGDEELFDFVWKSALQEVPG